MKTASMSGHLMFQSMLNADVMPELKGTAMGSVAQAALDFRQPVHDAITGKDDKQAIVDMLTYFMASKMDLPKETPLSRLNTGQNPDPKATRMLDLYDRL